MNAPQSKKLMQSKNLGSTARAISLAIGLSMLSLSGLSFAGSSAAQAADSKKKSAPRVDYFGASTSLEAPKATKPKAPPKELPVGTAGAESLESVAIKTPVVICFERIDDIRAQYVPSEKRK